MDLTKQFKEISITRNDVTETIKIPMIGQGTWGLNDTNTEQAVSDALSVGFSCIDTAQGYGNEDLVGKSIKKVLDNGTPRTSLFISSKLGYPFEKDKDLILTTPEQIEAKKKEIRTQIEKSFTDLGVDYIDSYYVHTPANWDDMQNESHYITNLVLQWQVLNEFYAVGKIKVLGISNCSIETLNALKAVCEMEHLQMPQVMQMPILIGHDEPERTKFCKENNIQPVAYSILGSKHLLNHELVVAMASKYGMTPAQLCTYYDTQILDIPSLTRSTNVERLKESSVLLPDVTLSANDIEILKACKDDCREWSVESGWHQNEDVSYPETPFDYEKINATKDDVGGIKVLDFLKYSSLDFAALPTSDTALNTEYLANAKKYCDDIHNLDNATMGNFILHLTPAKAKILDNCRFNSAEGEDYLSNWTLSALQYNLLLRNAELSDELIQKIYELNWNKQLLNGLEKTKEMPAFASNQKVDELIATFTPDTYTFPEPEHTTEPDRHTSGPRHIEGNLIYKSGDVSHIYLPYKTTTNEDSHLRLIQHEGKLYINVKDENSIKQTTCEILGASFVSVDGHEILQLKLNFKGESRVLDLPIPKEHNETMFEDLQKLLANNQIAHTEIEVFDCPRLSNFKFPPKSKDEFEINDALRSSKRVGQTLEEETLTLGSQTISGLKQNIELNKALGLKNKNQQLTLIDSSSLEPKGSTGLLNDVLVAVSSEDSPSPVAIFVSEKSTDGTEQIKLRLSKEFVENFKRDNPEVEIPLVEEKDGYYTYEVEKLKLSKDLNIEDVTIKSAGKDFAILFSALGCQIKGKNLKVGKQQNTKNPYNISVSTDFARNSFAKEKGCEFDREDPAYSALLIASIQMQRKKENEKPEKDRKEPVKLQFPPNVELYSIPFLVNENGTEVTKYLNVRKEGEKTYVYLHVTSENKKGIAIPRFYEVNVAGLEDSSSEKEVPKNPCLYLGLDDKGKNVTSVYIDMEYGKNAKSLNSLRDIMKGEFSKTPNLNEAEKADGKIRKIDGKDFTVYPRPAEPGAKITSFDEVAWLSRGPVEERELGQSNIIIPDPPELDREIIDGGGGSGGGDGGGDPPPPPPPEEPDEPMPDDIDWKTKVGKDKDKPKTGVRNTLIGIFALCVLFSVFIPFLQIAAIIVGCVAVINEVKPWNLVNVIKNAKNKKKTFKVKDGKDKQYEKDIQKSKDKINTNKNNLIKLQEERLKILNDPTLSESEKRKKLAAIDKQIEKKKIDIEKLQVDINNFSKQIEIIKTNKAENLGNRISNNRERENKKADAAGQKDIGVLIQNEIRASIIKEKLEQTQRDYQDCESLEAKETAGTITSEELERLKNLRKKLRKKNPKSQVESELDTAIINYNNAVNERTERENEVAEEKEIRDNSSEDERNSYNINGRTPKEHTEDLKSDIKETKKGKKELTGESVSLEDFVLTDETIENLPETDKQEALEEQARIQALRNRGTRGDRSTGGDGHDRETGS